MENKKIQQTIVREEFFDFTAQGLKMFELRKNPDLAGIRELMVIEHTRYDSRITSPCKFCDTALPRDCEIIDCCRISKQCIKKRKTFNWVKRNLSVIKIVRLLEFKKKEYQEKIDAELYSKEDYNFLLTSIEMIDKVLDFLEENYGNIRFYWYDLQEIK